jgi:tetratricopeptide (TPR) repeat protein
MFDMGLALADRFKMYSIYVKILVEDLKIFGGALEIMKERMAIKGIAKAIREYGQTLIRNEKNATRDLLMGLVMQIPSNVGLNTAIPPSDNDDPVYNSETEEWIINYKPKTFTYKQVVDYIICALDNNHDVLEEILLFLTQRIPKVDSFVYHKLFEIYLLQRRRSRGALQFQSLAIKSSSSDLLDPSTYEEKIQNLLQSTTSRYDKNYVLMLFQMYDYNEGIIYLSQIVENKQELIYYFMKTDDYKNILSTCKTYEEDSDLWIQALTYFSQRKDEGSMECIRQILNSIDHNIIAPPIVLNILSRNDRTRYSVMKDYLKRYMSYLTHETSQFNKGNL